jgi:ADP-ribose pyrophosphatase
MSAEIKSRSRVYEGKVLALEIVDLQLDGGRVVQQEVVTHQPSVGIVPVDEDGRLLLVRQFRSPAEGDLLEIPAGSADPDEDSETAAQRELQEEVNRRASRLRRIGGFYLAPGYCTEYMTIYVAEGLIDSSLQADDDEQIEVEPVTLDEALAWIASGQIQDVKTVAALLLYARDSSVRSAT